MQWVRTATPGNRVVILASLLATNSNGVAIGGVGGKLKLE